MRNHLLFLTSLFFLISCSSIPIKSLYQLSKVNLRTINPKVIAVAIKVPEHLKVRKLSLELSHTPEGETVKPLKFSLIKYDGSKEYKKYQESGYSISSYKLSEQDVVKLINYRQKEFISQNNKNKKYTTKVSVAYKGLCRTRKSNKKSVLLSILLKTNNTSNFFPLVQKMDLRAEASKKGLKVGKEVVKELCPSDLL